MKTMKKTIHEGRNTMAPRAITMTTMAVALGASTLMTVVAMACQTTPVAPPTRSEERPSLQGTAQGSPSSRPVDPRTQEQLARAIDEAEAPTTDDVVAAYASIRESWQGNRYRWLVRVVPDLCTEPERCNVLAFGGDARARGIVQGWMPRLELDPAAFADLTRRCADRPICPVEVEATLSELVVSTELPTAVRFRDVQVLGAR